MTEHSDGLGVVSSAGLEYPDGSGRNRLDADRYDGGGLGHGRAWSMGEASGIGMGTGDMQAMGGVRGRGHGEGCCTGHGASTGADTRRFEEEVTNGR